MQQQKQDPAKKMNTKEIHHGKIYCQATKQFYASHLQQPIQVLEIEGRVRG
jgi:hypothetical protein